MPAPTRNWQKADSPMFKKPLLPGLVWTFVIGLLTLLPGNYIPRVTTFLDWLGPDKLVHLILFGTYTFLLIKGFGKQSAWPFLKNHAIAASILVGIVFGLFTETMQRFVIPGRNGNHYDFLANLAGCMLGYAGWYISRRNEKKILRSSKNNN
jgi:VanZ family protein